MGELLNNLGLNFADKRMDICRQCPLYLKRPLFDPICNHKLYMDPVTGKSSMIKLEGYRTGCGCNLKDKTRNIDKSCPFGKW